MTRSLWPVERLIAVEPLAEMRAVLAREVPEAEVLAGFADSIPAELGRVDAVVVAQAFHWFANAATVREIARVLKPEGALALVWNKRDLDDPLMRGIHECLDPYRSNSPDFDNTPWREPFEAPDAPLRLVGRQRIAWDESLTLGHLKGRVCSISYVALLDDAGPGARSGARRASPAPPTTSARDGEILHRDAPGTAHVTPLTIDEEPYVSYALYGLQPPTHPLR